MKFCDLQPGDVTLDVERKETIVLLGVEHCAHRGVRLIWLRQHGIEKGGWLITKVFNNEISKHERWDFVIRAGKMIKP